MPNSTHFHRQLLGFLRQYSDAKDLRHLKALAWMVSALICSGQRAPTGMGTICAQSSAQSAECGTTKTRRFLGNERIRVESLYVPLVLAALSGWQQHRLYLALDTTVLWDRYCMIHLSVVCCGRAVPLLWRVLEHGSATVAFKEYKVLLRKARWLLRHHGDVMLLADRGNARP